MRKSNKIIMATVAILLCLVLITTSVASGIFAKFVITKRGEATITFEKFGVTVTMTPATSKLEAVGATIPKENNQVKETFTSTGHTITITGIKLKPGDDLTDAVKFTFSGTPSVNVKVMITPTITFYGADGKSTADPIYTVPASTIKDVNEEYISTAQSYMPIGFTFGDATATLTANDEVTANYSCSPWSANTTASTLQNAVAAGIASKITAAPNATEPDSNGKVICNDNVVTVTTFKKKAINFRFNGASTNRTYFYMGFCYPFEHGSTAAEIFLYDKISQYIAENADADISMTVSYTVRIEQV